ncbi:uncharacterized protein EI97DRAFT_367104 [Westerdykella ornata]|uniref:SWIM-type domain-containing protein n=1 Tax=Westerdykella ornata TaxID=318751 RepID=A0A6A6JX08_WESOR|nr:uncharacterized protein EI97DRAFT_367104 [Westerdykella ornata]KAF2280947.1 hypothetical protein EI97DRAFT_367104 [Westerdykella ornata]
MSADELSRLSLEDNMVTTRAAAARARTAPAVQESASGSPPSPSPTQHSQSASPTSAVLESTSGIKYDVGNLGADARRHAKEGFGANGIKMKYCRALDEDANQYLFFLDDEIRVAMGGRHGAPRCTCGANDKGIACKHIFWMLDQLASTASQKIREQTLEIAPDGALIQNREPASIIKNATLERVAENLDWEVHDGPVPDDEDIEEEVAAMLSVFEPTEALPVEFRAPGGAFLSERSRKYREFRDLITSLFTEQPSKNLGLFNKLQSIIDPDFQTHVFFEKINNRIVHTFKALDEYIAHGSTAPSEAYDVPTCARKLKYLVQAIDDYYEQQEQNGFDMGDISRRAAAALVTILKGVVDRNQDAYAGITWDGVPPEDETESNLFVNLIGAPVHDGDEDEEGLFVLDVLKKLPIEGILRSHWELLSATRAGLKPQWTPQRFLESFREIVGEGETLGRKRAGTGSEGTTPSPKRPAQRSE